MDNEEKYTDIRDKLRNLEKVGAGEDFVKKLHLKIVEHEAEKRKVHAKKYDQQSGGFLRNLFTAKQYPWLIPAAGFTVLLFFVFYVTYLNKNISEKSQQTVMRDSVRQEISQPVQKESVKLENNQPSETSEKKEAVKTQERITTKNERDLATVEPKPGFNEEKEKGIISKEDRSNGINTAVVPQKEADEVTDQKMKTKNPDAEATVAPEETKAATEPKDDSGLRNKIKSDTVKRNIEVKLDVLDKIKLEEIREKIERE